MSLDSTTLEKSVAKARTLYDYQEWSSQLYFNKQLCMKSKISWEEYLGKSLYRPFDRFHATPLKQRPTIELYKEFLLQYRKTKRTKYAFISLVFPWASITNEIYI